MEALIRRPVALFSLAFVYAGFACAGASDLIRYGIILMAALCLLFLPPSVRLGRDMRRLGRILFGALLCGVGFFTVFAHLIPEANASRLVGRPVVFVGTVEERLYAYSYEAGYAVRLQSADDEDAHFSLLLASSAVTLSPGDVIRFEAEDVAPILDTDQQEGWYYRSRGLILLAEAESVTRIGEAPFRLSRVFASMRETMAAQLSATLGRENAGLAAALFLGDRSLLGDTWGRDFRRLGISHMLAISGLHFTLLLGLCGRILAAVLPSRRLRILLLSGMGTAYMLLTGMSESVTRAGLMFLFAYLAVPLRRQIDLPTSLGVSALLICLLSPSAFYSVSLQLSVTGVLSLILFAPMQQRIRKKWDAIPVLRRLASPAADIAVGGAMQFVMLPLLCLYFGEISVLTPIMNVIFTPLIALVLTLTPLVLLMPTYTPLCAVVSALTDLTAALAEDFASLPGITISLRYALCPFFALALTTALAAVLLAQPRWKRRSCAALGCTLALFVGYLFVSDSAVTREDLVISVQSGKNEALILVADGRYLLADISDGSYGALTYAWEEAQRRHATELDALMLTHLHTRHIRAFDRLSDAVYVRTLILPTPRTDKEHAIATTLTETAERKGIPVCLYDDTAGDALTFGQMTITPGERTYLARSTHPVITLTIAAADQSIHYLGSAWNETKTPAIVAADVWILGTHGPVYKKNSALPDSASASLIIMRGSAADFISIIPTGTSCVTGGKTVAIRLGE